jgi:hypothetical protein
MEAWQEKEYRTQNEFYREFRAKVVAALSASQAPPTREVDLKEENSRLKKFKADILSLDAPRWTDCIRSFPIDPEEFKAHLKSVGRYDLDDALSVSWFPMKASNPSKLYAHKFVDGVWYEVPACRIITWAKK